MPINFPAAPANGAEYSYLGKSWRFNGTGWALSNGKPYGREILAADRTYYVATTGSDSNDGLTAGTPFLTIQKALDTIALLDISIFNVTIQCAAGTYTTAVSFKPTVGSGSVTLRGDPTTPANCIISTTGTCIVAADPSPVIRSITGFKLISSGGSGISLGRLACLLFSSIDFGACAVYHMAATGGAVLTATGNYAISGNAAVHCFMEYASICLIHARTVTFSGTVTIASGFAISRQGSMISAYGMTFAGTSASMVGPKYEAQTNGVIFVNGASTSYFPGSTAGAVSSGAQYA